MDDFWNTSETTPAALNNFFDEESNVTWTGTPENDNSLTDHKIVSSSVGNSALLKNASSSSILDNISVSSDSGISGIKSSRVKALGDKIDSWKPPSVSIKWKSDGESCSQCSSKNEEIKELNIRLERAFSRHSVTLPPGEMVHKMIIGVSSSLASYKTLKDKILLLDSSLESLDSSTILAVVIFLKNTLKRDIFIKELQKRPLAVQVYVNYLKQRFENSEAIDILKSVGRTEEAAILLYYISIKSKNSESLLKSLKQVYQTNFQDQKNNFEAKMVKQHIDLLEIQIPIDKEDAKDTSNQIFIAHPRATSLVDLPLLTTLYYCSMYHWDASENLTKSSLHLRKNFSISDRQFLWTVIRARARVKHWPLPSDLDNIMSVKGIIGTLASFGGFSGGKVVKNSISIDRVIDFLANSGAPPNVLFSYITLLDSNEEKLKLGLSYKCHEAVIEAYVNMKNSEDLELYMKQIVQGSPDYVKADQALKILKRKR